jgi:hypothetical protein
MLPKPKHKMGYTSKELDNICKVRGIDKKKFSKAFGNGNTCSMNKQGETIFYLVDVERALNTLGHKDGKFHLWD